MALYKYLSTKNSIYKKPQTWIFNFFRNQKSRQFEMPVATRAVTREENE